MKSIAARNSVLVDENLYSSKTSKRKQGSTTLRTLKESFRFRGSISPKKSESQTISSTYASPPKIRRSSIDRQDSRKTKQRFSAQRVSLFKYEYVRVRSSSVLRRGSSSTISSDTTRSSDNASYSSSKSRGSVRVKPTTLMAKGVLEVYQICTPKANAADKQQEMNYLSLGRKDNIVHPILPRLQVTKTAGPTQRFIVHFYNPDRFWEIEFLAPSAAASKEVLIAAKEFESVMLKICDYTIAKEESVLQKNATVADEDPPPELDREFLGKCGSNVSDCDGMMGNCNVHRDNTTKDIKDDDDEDDVDDLGYLLEGDDDVEGIEEKSNNTQWMNDLHDKSNEEFQDGAINKAFRKAMQNVKPSAYHSRRGSTSERLIDYHSSRRFSSYQPLNYEEPSLSRRLSYAGSKRSTSVPTWSIYETPLGVTRRGKLDFIAFND